MSTHWPWLICYVFGGLFITNAAPHLASGLMGRPFQSPFAKPPGRGLSSPTVNVLWGCGNLMVGYVLLAWVGKFDIQSGPDAAALGVGVLVTSLLLARMFGAVNGGDGT